MLGLLSTLMLIAGIAFLLLFLYCLSMRGSSLAMPFALICLAAGIYIIGYSFEIRADDLETISFFLKIEYFGVSFLSSFWLLLTYRYTRWHALSLPFTILVMVVPFITLLLSGTNEYHQLLYRDVLPLYWNGHLLADIVRGPWYYIQMLYSIGIQIYATTVLFLKWKNGGFRRRTQVFYIFLGSIWPFVVSSFYFFEFTPLELDLTPISLIASAVCFSIALFRYRILDMNDVVKDLVFTGINEGILVLDDRDRIISYNKAATRIFPWLDRGRIGEPLAATPHGPAILAGEGDQFELDLPYKSGVRYYELRLTILRERRQASGKVYFIQDITRQKELFLTLKDMATYDSLTKVFNRRKLIEESERELQRCRRYGHELSLVMLDVDDFKRINDTYGHQAGDEMLRQVARICRERLRATDLIGRYGGEEFLLLLPDTGREAACRVAEEIRSQLDAFEISYRNETLRVTASFGVTTQAPRDVELVLEKLIHDADSALLEAKANGKNRVACFPG